MALRVGPRSCSRKCTSHGSLLQFVPARGTGMSTVPTEFSEMSPYATQSVDFPAEGGTIQRSRAAMSTRKNKTELCFKSLSIR